MISHIATDAQTFPRGPQIAELSRVIGHYQAFLVRYLAHFFPESVLTPLGKSSVMRRRPQEVVRYSHNYELQEDEIGLGLEVAWMRARYHLHPGVPVPFSEAERRMVRALLEVLDLRFRSLFDPDAAHREVFTNFDIGDLAVARFLGTPGSDRIPAALEALRQAALSTYENRRQSTGVLLLGTETDPTAPDRSNVLDAPRYDAHLSALKSVHRLCDGLNTILLLDRQGRLAWPVDIHRWAEALAGECSGGALCLRAYRSHSLATRSGGHVALVLTPNQEIRVFAHGRPQFVLGDGRWRLMDLPGCFQSWKDAVGPSRPENLAERLFHAALNISEQRGGALFVVLRDPARSIPQVLAPGDLIQEDELGDGVDDPDYVSPRQVKRTLHYLVHGQDIHTLDDRVLESLAGIDGAVVADGNGRLLSFGAILRLTSETMLAPRAVNGARTTAALAASFHGPVLKVSEDGLLTMYLGGRRIWEF